MPAATLADPQAELDKILAGIEKKYGAGTIHRGSETQKVMHLPFLQSSLNYATEGGAPFGRFMSAYGDESVGKSRMAYELIMQLQNLPESYEVVTLPRIAYHTQQMDNIDLSDALRAKHLAVVARLTEELEWIRETFPDGADAVYYNAEQQWDPSYAARIGLDTDRVRIVESTTIEEIVEIMQNLYGHYCMHVVDSTSSASSLLQQKQEMGKSLMGTDARQWKSCLKAAMPFFDPNRNMGILIHQMSTNLRTGGSQAVSSKFLRHTSSCSIKFSRGKFLWRKDGVLVEDKPTGADEASLAGIAEPHGVEVFAKIEKSRTCRPFRAAGLQFDYEKLRYIDEHSMANSGLYFGEIIKSGSWYKRAGEEANIGQGLKTVYARLQEDEQLQSDIYVRLLDYTAEA